MNETLSSVLNAVGGAFQVVAGVAALLFVVISQRSRRPPDRE